MHFRNIALCFAVSPLLMGASEPVRLQPASQWDVDFGDDSCRLIRLFGEGGNQTKLVFESIAPGNMSMMIVGEPIPAQVGPFGGAQIWTRFVPGQQAWFAGVSAKAEQGGQPAGLWSHAPLEPLPNIEGVRLLSVSSAPKTGPRPAPTDLAKRATENAAQLAFEAKVTELEIKGPRGHLVDLETGPLGDPLKVFNQCMRDLVSSWGIDPDVQEKIVRPAWTADIRSWFSANDYPQQALAEGQESTVTFRLIVDATGRVTKCASFSKYDAPLFNTVVCNVLKLRARFAPAELADGTKVASYVTDQVSFRIAM